MRVVQVVCGVGGRGGRRSGAFANSAEQLMKPALCGLVVLEFLREAVVSKLVWKLMSQRVARPRIVGEAEIAAHDVLQQTRGGAFLHHFATASMHN